MPEYFCVYARPDNLNEHDHVAQPGQVCARCKATADAMRAPTRGSKRRMAESAVRGLKALSKAYWENFVEPPPPPPRKPATKPRRKRSA